MTAAEFTKCIAVLSAGVGREMTQATAEVWYQVLGDLTAEQLQQAIVTALRSYKFAGFPPVGQIREWAGAGAGSTEDAAAIAWSKVLRAMRLIGGYQSVEWDDPAIPFAIDSVAGGWNSLCEMQSSELHSFGRAKFIAAYKSATVTALAGPTITTGILAADAARLGGEAPEPLRLGDSLPDVAGFLQRAENEPPRLPAQQVVFRCIESEDSRPTPPSDEDLERRRLRQVAALQKMELLTLEAAS